MAVGKIGVNVRVTEMDQFKEVVDACGQALAGLLAVMAKTDSCDQFVEVHDIACQAHSRAMKCLKTYNTPKTCDSEVD